MKQEIMTKKITMKYYFEKSTTYTFEAAIERVTEVLKKEGFGILARIDMHKTLKEKINVDIEKYSILEACNPPFAYKSLQVEEMIGIMLPCNFVVREVSDKVTKVAIVNAVSVMQAVNNPAMDEIAKEIHEKLKKVIENL
jgi:uncharacterized protein (DUF302 family)